MARVPAPREQPAPRLRLSLFPAVSLAALLAVARGLSAVDGYHMHRRRALCCALDVEWVARLRTLCLRFVRSRAVMAKRMSTRYASEVGLVFRVGGVVDLQGLRGRFDGD